MGVLFKEPLSSEACLGRVEAAAFHYTYLRAGNMKNGGGQGITESQHLMHALKRLDTKEGYFGRENAASYSFTAVKTEETAGHASRRRFYYCDGRGPGGPYRRRRAAADEPRQAHHH